MGADLWRLLREPSTAAQAVGVLQAAFPGTDPERIASDAGSLLADLLANDLIVVHDDPGAAGSGPVPMRLAREA